MNRALWKKAFIETRLLLASTALIMFAFAWLRVWIVSLLPMERFRTIIEQFREFEHFLPVPLEQLFTYVGRIALTFDELIVVMCITVWAIARGSDTVSGELNRGTMEMLLAQPVSRRQVMSVQVVTTLIGLVVLSSFCWLGIYLGIQTTTVEEPIPMLGGGPWSSLGAPAIRVPMATKAAPWVFVHGAINLFWLGFFLAGLTTLLSACDRYRWRTIGIASGIYVVQLIVKIVGLSTPNLAWLKPFSFFSAYEPEKVVSVAENYPDQVFQWIVVDQAGTTELGPLSYYGILLLLGLVCFGAAFMVFQRRDLPAPV